MPFQIKDEKHYEFAWKHNGLIPAGEDAGKRMKVEDALSTMNAPVWLPRVVENIVREAAEPLLIGTRLLQRVEFRFGQTITFPAVGALDAADIGEGMAYPERQLQVGGATTTASVGKSGVAVSITEEMIRYSQFDLINMHLRAAGRALARHKEKKIFNYIRSLGVVCFDNLVPTSAVYGVTHGRGLNGSANGSLIADDLFDAFSQVMMQGFTPNTVLMHPLTWAMWSKDPILRAFALANGGGVWFATHTGNPAGRAPWDNASQGKMGVSGGQDIVPGGNAGSQTATPVEGYPQDITSAPQLPTQFPFPFGIIVSPFVPFNPSTKLTDVYLFDSAELGALIVDEDITTDEWTDPSVDIRKIKMRERYGIAIFNEGLGVAVMKNIKVVPNEVVLPASATIDVSGSLAAIPATTPLSL